MTYANDADGAKAWGVNGDATDGTAPRMYEDATTGPGLGLVPDTTAPLPPGHTRWIKSVPTAAAFFRYDGNALVLPLATDEPRFSVCVRYLRFSGLPTANVNCFLTAIAKMAGVPQYNQRRVRLRTDGTVVMTTSDENQVIGTSVSTVPVAQTVSAVLTMDTNKNGSVRTALYIDNVPITWSTGDGFIDFTDVNNPPGLPEAVGFSLASPLSNDNGISTFYAECGVVLASAYSGDYAQGFAAGKLAANADSADPNYVEWTPAAGVDHYAMINAETPGIFYVQTTVADEQELFGYAASNADSLPGGNTPLALKFWGNLRSSASLPDAVALRHLIRDLGAYFQFASHDYSWANLNLGTQLCSAVTLGSMPAGGGAWTPDRIAAVEAGLDKAGDAGLNYRLRAMFGTLISISNPRSAPIVGGPPRHEHGPLGLGIDRPQRPDRASRAGAPARPARPNT